MQLSVPACKTGNSEPDSQLWTGTAPLSPRCQEGAYLAKIRHQASLARQAEWFTSWPGSLHPHLRGKAQTWQMLLWYRYYTTLPKLNWQCSFQRESLICLACGLCLQGTYPYINNYSLHHRSKEVLMFSTNWASTVDKILLCPVLFVKYCWFQNTVFVGATASDPLQHSPNLLLGSKWQSLTKTISWHSVLWNQSESKQAHTWQESFTSLTSTEHMNWTGFMIFCPINTTPKSPVKSSQPRVFLGRTSRHPAWTEKQKQMFLLHDLPPSLDPA